MAGMRVPLYTSAMASVLLIPGFGGNVLRHRWPTYTGWRDAWLEPTVLLATGLEILALDDAGVGPHVPFFPSLSAGTAIGLYYPLLLDSLRGAGYRLGVGRSDWRKPIATSAGAVADSIANIAEDDGPVRVVAHSRGGLVAQAAVQILAARGQLAAVHQVVTLGTPWQGTYAAVPWFGGWMYHLGGEAVLSWTAPGLLFASQQFRNRLRFVCATFPGMYELLPSPAGAAAAGDGTADQLYDAAPWSASGVPVLAPHQAAARSRWAAEAGWPGGVRLDSVVGAGRGTLMGPCALSSLDRPEGLPGLTDGDGVVPLWSAQPPGRAGIVLPLGHQQLVTDPTAHQVVLGLLR